MSRPIRNLVPGRRIIDEDHACAMRGYYVNQSYMDDPTIVEENSTFMDDTLERDLKKKGMNEGEIMMYKQKKNHERLDKARDTLHKGMRGANDFEGLMEKYNFGQGAKENPPENAEDPHSFAVPRAPANMKRREILSSTPKNPNHTSRSFRCLDISQVVNTEISLLNVSNPPTAPVFVEKDNGTSKNTFTKNQTEGSNNGTFTIEKNQTDRSTNKTFTKDQQEAANTRETFTIEKNQTDGSLQRTYTKDQPEDASLKGTFTKEKDVSDSSSRRTFVKENNTESSERSKNNGTFVVNATTSDLEATFTQPTTTDMPAKKMKAPRGKRDISLASSMLETSMLNVAESPGAKLFVRRPKKLRPSTDSQNDKSPTIQMESINETENSEQTGMSSYVDAITEHNLEEEEARVRQRLSTDVAHTNTSALEKVRDAAPIRQTPTRNYLKATFSSIQKSASKNKPQLADATLNKTPISTPIQVFTPIRSNKSIPIRLSQRFDEEDDEEEEDSVGATAVITQGEPVDFSALQSTSDQQSSLNSIEKTLDVLNIQDPIGNISFNDGGLDPEDEDEEVEMDVSNERRSSQRLLDGSLASVNTPGLFVRPRGRAPRNVDDSVYDDTTYTRSTRNRPKEMVLAKRDLIKPTGTNDNGLRRSSRTKVKPLRTWLGEQAVYVKSPSGSKRLVGVTEVVIKDKRMIKYKNADPRVVLERQEQERKIKKERAEQRRRDLEEDHRNGINLDTTQEDILTSEDEE